jgi:hypothetical protein
VDLLFIQSVRDHLLPPWFSSAHDVDPATVVIFVALLLSFSTHTTVTLAASLVSFLAALLTLIAFAIDIALFAYLKHQVNKLAGVAPSTKPAPGQPAIKFPLEGGTDLF